MYFSKTSSQIDSNFYLFNDDKNENENEISKIRNIKNNPFFRKSYKDSLNEEKNRFYINTEYNIFNDKNNINRKNEKKKYNLSNYKNIINKKIGNNISSYEEQLEANLINSFFDSLKLRKVKKELLKNKTNFYFKDKNILTMNKINDNYNYNYTNPERLKMVKISNNLNKRRNLTLPKNGLNYNINNLKKEKINIKKDFFNSFKNKPNNNNEKKLKKNKTDKTEFPNIKIIKNNLEDLILKVDKLDNDFKKTKSNYLFESQDLQKINSNIKMPHIKNKEISDINYNDEKNKNFLKNKKIFNKYIEKFTNYKYKNKDVNSFFKKKTELSKNNLNYILNINKESEEDILRKEQKNSIFQIKLLNEIKEFKNKVKNNIDKDIFKMFNKNT